MSREDQTPTRLEIEAQVQRQAEARARELMGWRLGHKFVITEPDSQKFRIFELTCKEVTP